MGIHKNYYEKVSIKIKAMLSVLQKANFKSQAYYYAIASKTSDWLKYEQY